MKLPKTLIEEIKKRNISQKDLIKIISRELAQYPVIGRRVIDPTPADNGDSKMQVQWIYFFNQQGKATGKQEYLLGSYELRGDIQKVYEEKKEASIEFACYEGETETSS